AGDVTLGVVDGSAQIELNTAGRALECVVAFAQRRLWIATPYFSPTERLTELLTQAAGRGVEVRVMIPGPHIDKRVSLIAAKEHALELVDAGVWFHRYRPSMLHVKQIVADQTLSMVGSVNFNQRSVHKDEEVAVVAIDHGLNEMLAADYLEDMARCDAISDRDHIERSWAETLTAKAAQVVEGEM